jgi:hypothetical protein
MSLLDAMNNVELAQAVSDLVVTGSDRILLDEQARFARRDGRPGDAAIIRGEIDRTAMDHLAAGIVLEGKSEGALSEKTFTYNDIEKAEELHHEASFELNSIEGGEV